MRPCINKSVSKSTKRQRHLVVDTLGYVVKAFVTKAYYHDGQVGTWHCPRLKHLWADGQSQEKRVRMRFYDKSLIPLLALSNGVLRIGILQSLIFGGDSKGKAV